MTGFEYELEQRIGLAHTSEYGIIIARAQYAHGNENQYLIRYVTADGRQVEAWWAESALARRV